MDGAEPIAWVEGRVFTGRRWEEGLLVDDGRVVAVGSSEEIRRSAPTGTTVRSLSGLTVIPGLVDSHLHIRASVLHRLGVDLSECRDAEAVVERLRSGAALAASGPILAGGWDESRFATPRYLTSADLDRVSLERPVIAYRHCLHVAAVNSVGLDALGVNSSTPDPPGGRVGRSDSGAPDGLLYDRALVRLIPLEVQRLAHAEAELGSWLGSAAAMGLTSIGAMSADVAELRLLSDMYRSRPSPVRIRAYVRAEGIEAIDSAEELRSSEALRITGVKAFADGAFGPRTAWLTEPYGDAPDSRGMAGSDPAELGALVRWTADRRLQIAVHAIGDRAIRQTLRVFRSEPAFGVPRIEHVALTPPEILDELTTVRPALVVQPSFVASDTWLAERLGAERARWTYAFRSLVSLGLVVAGSSDSPVETMNPWVGMSQAVAARPAPAAEETLSDQQALALYTSQAGAALGEPEIGSLLPGAFADYVVLEGEDWSKILARGVSSVAATYRSGRSTFERGREPTLGTPASAQSL